MSETSNWPPCLSFTAKASRREIPTGSRSLQPSVLSLGALPWSQCPLPVTPPGQSESFTTLLRFGAEKGLAHGWGAGGQTLLRPRACLSPSARGGEGALASSDYCTLGPSTGGPRTLPSGLPIPLLPHGPAGPTHHGSQRSRGARERSIHTAVPAVDGSAPAAGWASARTC